MFPFDQLYYSQQWQQLEILGFQKEHFQVIFIILLMFVFFNCCLLIGTFFNFTHKKISKAYRVIIYLLLIMTIFHALNRQHLLVLHFIMVSNICLSLIFIIYFLLKGILNRKKSKSSSI